MRIYKVNPDGEKQYILECENFECKYSPDAVFTIMWTKEYENNIKCKKCGAILTETMPNYSPLPKLNQTT